MSFCIFSTRFECISATKPKTTLGSGEVSDVEEVEKNKIQKKTRRQKEQERVEKEKEIMQIEEAGDEWRTNPQNASELFLYLLHSFRV